MVVDRDASGDLSSAHSSGSNAARRRWWAVVVAAAIVVCALAVTLSPLWPALHSQWTEVAAYQHGYLLAPVAGWLVWRSWQARPPAILRPGWQFLLPLAALLAILVLLELLYLNVPRLFLLPPLLIVCAGLVFGRAVATRFFWPAMLMFGALPVWALINGTLQALTTFATSWALASTNVPAFIEGNFVRLPSGVFEIAEGCSGLKYLIVGTTLSLVAGLAFLATWRERLLLLAVAVISSILCNWVRVYIVILVGYVTEMEHPLVDDHTALGWILFVAFMLPVMWFARRLERSEDDRLTRPARTVVAHAPGIVAAAIVASLLLVAVRAGVVAVSRAGEPSGASFASFASPAFSSVDLTSEGQVSAWQPRFMNATETRAVLAQGSNVPVEVYLAAYPRMDASHRLIAYDNSFVPEPWQSVGERKIAVSTSERTVEVIEHEGYLEQDRRLVWAWYRVAGEPTTGSLEAKMFELRGLLAGRRDGLAVAVSTKCELDNCDAARAHLTAFVDDYIEILKWDP